MPVQETSFKKLVEVPVHYDRLDPRNGYGSKGTSRTFKCTTKLKSTSGRLFRRPFPGLEP